MADIVVPLYRRGYKMNKAPIIKKDAKKKPLKTMKEKRAAKREKKTEKKIVIIPQ